MRRQDFRVLGAGILDAAIRMMDQRALLRLSCCDGPSSAPRWRVPPADGQRPADIHAVPPGTPLRRGCPLSCRKAC
jgi:hypothetical protein